MDNDSDEEYVIVQQPNQTLQTEEEYARRSVRTTTCEVSGLPVSLLKIHRCPNENCTKNWRQERLKYFQSDEGLAERRRRACSTCHGKFLGVMTVRRDECQACYTVAVTRWLESAECQNELKHIKWLREQFDVDELLREIENIALDVD